MITWGNIAELGPRHLPIEDVSVVEVGDSPPGRLLAKLLIDQGAKVEHFDLAEPGMATADGRSPAPRRLDLDQSEDREELIRVASEADVLIDGTFRGALAQAGLSFEELSRSNGSLLYCRLSSFPEEADSGSDEYVEWLIAGELGLHRTKGVAERETITLVTAYGAATAALYIAAGLVQRERTSRGSEIDVSMFGAGVLLFGLELSQVATPSLRNRSTDQRLPIIRIWECADGRFLQSQGDSPPPLAATMRALGHPEWIDEAITALISLEDREQEAMWVKRMGEIFITRPAAEWEARLAAEGAAGTVCRSREEWMAEPHALDSGIFEIDESGETVVGPAVRVFSPSTPGVNAKIRPWPARKENERLPLAGIRVIDLTTVLAGPTCSRALGELGADVIKVDSPNRLGSPWTHPYGWLEPNRSKRTLVLDLKTGEGREALWRLIEDADVLTENYRAGKIASLGFSFDEVVKRNPQIVYLSMNAYDYGGAFTERPGWESNGQAVSGMQVFQEKDGRPRQLRPPTNDLATGWLGAYGTMLGLYSAHRTGRAQRVFGSLSRTGTFIQTLEYGKANELDPVEIIEIDDSAIVVEGGKLDRSELEAIVKGASVSAGIEALKAAGLRAGEARAPHDLLEVDWVRKAGLVADWEHPRWGKMTSVFAHGTATNFEQRRGWPAKNPGTDTRAILHEAGLSDAEIQALVDRGIARDETPIFERANEHAPWGPAHAQ